MAVRKKPRRYNGEVRWVWEARWKDPKTGKWPSKTFRTKKEAEAHYAEMVEQTRRGTFVRDRDTVTLAKAWFAFLDDLEMRVRAGDIGRSSAIIYRNHGNHFLLPEFGGYRLNEIDHDLVKPYLHGRAASEKWSYVAYTLNVLRQVLNFAVRMRWLPRNPLRDDPIPRPRHAVLRHVKEPSLEQVHQLVAALARGPEYGDLNRTFANARMSVALGMLGLRNGERAGLQWEDVDFEAGWLHVRHALTRYLELKPPKSGKPRRLPLPDGVRAVLWEHNQQQGSPTSGFVMRAEGNGKPINPERINRHYHPWAMRRAGLVDLAGKPDARGEPPILFTSHALRRFCASYQRRNKVPLAEIQAVLGHRYEATTAQYLYWDRETPEGARVLGRLGDDVGLQRLANGAAPALVPRVAPKVLPPPEPSPTKLYTVRGQGRCHAVERPRYRNEVIELAVQRQDQGASIPAIAAELGTTHTTLLRWLKAEGLYRPRDWREQRALALSLYEAGVPWREIAERTGATTTTVSAWLAKAGVPRQRRQSRDWSAERARAVEMHASGAIVHQIAKELKVGTRRVSDWLREAGFALERGGRARLWMRRNCGNSPVSD